MLAKEWYGEDFVKYRPMAAMMGFCYGILNLFPAFGIPFASIPLALYLLLRIYRKPSVKLYVLLFCYPFFSYFSYHGFYSCVSSGRDYLAVDQGQKGTGIFDGRFGGTGAWICVFEYRLFYVMLFGGVETIRATMAEADLTAERYYQSADVWLHGMFHAESVHDKLVLWICAGYFFWRNGKYVAERKYKAIFHDVYNLLMLLLVFNSVVYGIYNWGLPADGGNACSSPERLSVQPYRVFSPFLWYGAYFMILQRMYTFSFGTEGREAIRRWSRWAANGLALAAAAVILLTPSRYNDLFLPARIKRWKS